MRGAVQAPFCHVRYFFFRFRAARPAAAATIPAATAAASFARGDFFRRSIAFLAAAPACRPIADAWSAARCIAVFVFGLALLLAGVALTTLPFFLVPFRTTARDARATTRLPEDDRWDRTGFRWPAQRDTAATRREAFPVVLTSAVPCL